MSSEKIEEALTKETLKNDKPYFFPRLVAYIYDSYFKYLLYVVVFCFCF